MKLVIAGSAWESLDRLQKHWAQYNSDEVVQDRTDRLIDETQWLCDWPGAGSQELFMTHRGKRYRKWVVGNVKIIYRIVGDELRITDYFDSRQDPKRMKG